MNPCALPTEPAKKKRKQRKPGVPSFMKPAMVMIVGLITGFGVVQTVIVLLKSR